MTAEHIHNFGEHGTCTCGATPTPERPEPDAVELAWKRVRMGRLAFETHARADYDQDVRTIEAQVADLTRERDEARQSVDELQDELVLLAQESVKRGAERDRLAEALRKVANTYERLIECPWCNKNRNLARAALAAEPREARP